MEHAPLCAWLARTALRVASPCCPTTVPGMVDRRSTLAFKLTLAHKIELASAFFSFIRTHSTESTSHARRSYGWFICLFSHCERRAAHRIWSQPRVEEQGDLPICEWSAHQKFEAVTATRRLADLSENIKAPSGVGQQGMRGSSVDECALEAICEGCISVSKELITKIEKLRVGDGRRYRTFKGFRQALKIIWSKEAVDEMAQ